MPDSLLFRYEPYFACAAVAAHATRAADSKQPGFRQRDVRFFIELFSNWSETTLSDCVLRVQNTQISRFLRGLVAEGYARLSARKGRDSFYLTRIGLIELITRAVSRSYFEQREQFFFVYYFVANYKGIISELVQREGQQFPPALQMELQSLLDESSFLDRQLTRARSELEKLERRIHDAQATIELARDGVAQGLSLEDIVREAQRKYPYELNSQKPLKELISDIPERSRLWELEKGNQMRIEQIWKPGHELLLVFIRQLERLARH